MFLLKVFIFGILACETLTTAGFSFDSAGKTDRSIENRNETSAEAASWYRLPEYVVPVSYELWILPELGVENFTYEGRVIIDLHVLNQTDSIIVHVEGLKIDKKKSQLFAKAGGISREVDIHNQELDTKRQFYIVSCATALKPGNYSLSLSFTGEIVDDVLGFYRSSHKVNGKTRWLGFTQFSTTFARRAFPCLDEPYLKAIYRIHLGHYGNETVTGNTVAEKTEEIKPGYFVTTLAKTPRMSTYLVGWAIHDFKLTNAANSTFFGLWAREDMKNHTFRALEEGRKIYDALDKWIDVANPIKKMEQIAVPDFYFSAMENWGMITFRESVVLWKDEFTPTSSIHRGLSTIAHEYAHTWFGNLVTPKFWNVAWLKEGFATFFGHYGQSLVSNESKIMDLFAVEVLQSALLEDSVQHERTMNGRGIGSPESIHASMDFVAYKKGSSIIRMIKHIIGDWAFHQGLQSYVMTLKYSYATPENFYQHLQKFSDQSNVLDKDIQISDVIETWASQPGYPVVTVIRNYITNETEISQQRFRLNPNNEYLESDDSRWYIPVNFAVVKSNSANVRASPAIWMRSREKSILISTIQSTDALLCNIDQAYYYRVNYDKTNWQRLTNHLNSDDFFNIGESNRASLIDDSFNLAKAGYIDYSVPLTLLRYLIREKDYGPWLAATNSFNFLNTMLSNVPNVHRGFKAFVNHLTEPIWTHVTTNDLSSNLLRPKLLIDLISSTVCSVDNIKCTNTASALFKNWLSGPNETINPDVRNAVYCTGIRLGSENEWREVWRIFRETELHTEQELLIAGLGCTNNSVLVKELLNYSLYDGPEVRKQYRIALFNAVLAGNPENVEHVLSFVAENFMRIIQMKDPSALNKIFDAIKKRIVSASQLQKLEVIVESNIELLGSTIVSARKAINFAEENIAWIKSYVPGIAKWLREEHFLSAY